MVSVFICGDFRAKDASKIKFSNEIKNIIQSSDISIVNFEAPVHVEGARGRDKSGPVLDQDPKSPDLLMKYGFNVILLANNHIMDYGIIGCEKTKSAFKNCLCVGAGKPKDAYKVAIKECNGFKIGFLSLVQHEFGVVNYLDDIDTYGAAWVLSYDIEEIIKDTKKECDYVLVFPHAGVEHIDAPLPQWRKYYKKLVDWGADSVIASHPHCPQGWEVYRGHHIFYSLGNLYFDGLNGNENWYRSIGVKVLIDKSRLTFSTLNLVFEESGLIKIDQRLESKMNIDHINKLLEDEKEYQKYIDTKCKEIYDGYKYDVMRGVGGFSFHLKFSLMFRLFAHFILNHKNEADLLNICQNESHRWVIENALNRNNE